MFIVKDTFTNNIVEFNTKQEAVDYAVRLYRQFIRSGDIDIRVVEHEDYTNGIFYDAYPGREFSISVKEEN